MENNRKIIIFILLALLILGIFGHLDGLGKPVSVGSQQLEEVEKVEQKELVALQPTMFIGDVLVVNADSIKVVKNEEELTIFVDSNTNVIHQVRKDEGYVGVPTTLSEITNEMKAAVFYMEYNGIYTATSIQVVNF